MSVYRNRVVARLGDKNDALPVYWQGISTLGIRCYDVNAIAYPNVRYTGFRGVQQTVSVGIQKHPSRGFGCQGKLW